MAKTPYEILGVPQNATDEQIRAAYLEMAKKYHPDNYPDPNMAELAEEKMKEINEAYEELKNRQAGTSRGSYADSVYAEVRRLISNRSFAEAEVKLDAIIASERGAEWHFLKGCLLTHRGWYLDAQKYFETACRMDPQNKEYRQALESLHYTANGYSRQWEQGNAPQGGVCCMPDFCTALICADCLCDCCNAGC